MPRGCGVLGSGGRAPGWIPPGDGQLSSVVAPPVPPGPSPPDSSTNWSLNWYWRPKFLLPGGLGASVGGVKRVGRLPPSLLLLMLLLTERLLTELRECEEFDSFNRFFSYNNDVLL